MFTSQDNNSDATVMPTGKDRTVIGIYPDVDTARAGIEQLHANGFTREDIALVTRDSEAAAEIPSQAAAEKATKASGTGAAIGGVSGGILGGLVGAGLLAIPGAGPLLALGWFATAIGGALTGAAAGGWIGSTAALGVPDDVVKEYWARVEQGNFLVMVLTTSGDDEERAKSVLNDTDAFDVASYPFQAQPKEFPGGAGTQEQHTKPY